MPKVGLLNFQFLDSTFCRLDSTFRLDSTLKLYCAKQILIKKYNLPGGGKCFGHLDELSMIHQIFQRPF